MKPCRDQIQPSAVFCACSKDSSRLIRVGCTQRLVTDFNKYFCDLCNLSTILTFLSRESVAKLLQRLFEQGFRFCFYVLPGVVSIILEREHAHFSLKDFLEDQQEASHCRSERYQQHRAYSHRVGETLVSVPYTPDVKNDNNYYHMTKHVRLQGADYIRGIQYVMKPGQ